MREGGAIEVETERIVRTVAYVFEPQESGVGIDETSDQPGAGDAIYP